MIGGVGQDGGLARAAIEAALARQGQAAGRVEARVALAFEAPVAGASPGAAPSSPVEATAAPTAGARAGQAVSAIDAAAGDVERLPLDLAAGGIQDFSELAARLKQSELTFKFALEVRNKLIDAYRETMRMSV
jgi:flagellar hook-basal body complex protein FliE